MKNTRVIKTIFKTYGLNTTISMNDLIFAYSKQSQDAYNKLNSQLNLINVKH